LRGDEVTRSRAPVAARAKNTVCVPARADACMLTNGLAASWFDGSTDGGWRMADGRIAGSAGQWLDGFLAR
jgi:hypothetical protein